MPMKPWEMDVAIGTDTFGDRSDLLKVAVAADRAGLRNFWITESLGRDAFTALTSIAEVTKTIGLGTGIVNTYARTPTATALAAASVMEIMDGRTFNLGVGSSGKQLIEKLHGVPFDRPMSRMQEFVQVIDHIFRTGTVPDGGDIFATQGVDVTVPLPPREQLKIFIAGLTPRTIEITGGYADGWLPLWPSKTRGVDALETLRAAATAAGRPMPEIAPYIYGVVSGDPAMVQLVRRTLAWYIAANGVAYRHMFERMGYVDETAEICALWEAGDREKARHIVDQAMFDDTTLTGEPEEFERNVEAFRAAGIDRPVLRLPEGLDAQEMVAMIARLERAA